MIKVVARNTVKKEKIEEFIAIAEKLVELTNRNDAGCIHYSVYQDLSDPRILTFIEEWESMDALNEHMAADHFKDLVPKLGAFADGPEDVHLYQQVK